MRNTLQSGKMGNDKKHASKELKRKKNNIEQKSEIVKKKKKLVGLNLNILGLF